MRPKGNNNGLGYSSYEKGESSKTKDGPPKDKLVSERMKLGKKIYKPICFNCHKVRHISNVYRSKFNTINANRSNEHNAYIATSRKFSGYCYTCNKFGHKAFECR